MGQPLLWDNFKDFGNNRRTAGFEQIRAEFCEIFNDRLSILTRTLATEGLNALLTLGMSPSGPVTLLRVGEGHAHMLTVVASG